MNWLNVFGLMLGGLVLFFALLRVERRSLWIIWILLVAPTAVLVAGWAALRQQWPETALGILIAGMIAGGWWLLRGRYRPRPSSDSIKVWGQDRPKTQDVAAMQAEILRLKEEQARMEAELRRLKGGRNGPAEQ